MIYQYNRALSGMISLYLKGLYVKPNTTYRFSADVLGDPFVFYISQRGIRDGNKTYKTPQTATWTELSFEFSTTDDSHTLTTQFSDWGISFLRLPDATVQEIGNAYVDNVRLVDVQNPDINLIEGGTFESKSSAVYKSNWSPEILGLSGKTHGVTIVTDPLNQSNHCLLLPKSLLSQSAPESLPITVSQFRRYQKNETDITDYTPDTGNEYLCLFPQRGEIRCKINEVSYFATSNMMIIVPPGSSLKSTYLHGSTTDYFYFRFRGTEASMLMEKLGLNAPCVLLLTDSNAFAELVIRMLHLSPGNETYFHALSGLALLFISELELQITAAKAHSKYRFLIEKITEQMQECPEVPRSNEELAKECGISKSHFINLFRQYTGCTPKQYRLRELVRKACVLLDTTPLNIQEISFSLNIEDPLYFSRLFKSIQGVSPREYRKTKKEPLM